MELYPDELKGLSEIVRKILPTLSESLIKHNLTVGPIAVYDTNGAKIGNFEMQMSDRLDWVFSYDQKEGE